MKIKTQKYISESAASEAAHRSHTGNIKAYGEENCAMSHASRVIILDRPDQFEGTIRVRYEW